MARRFRGSKTILASLLGAISLGGTSSSQDLPDQKPTEPAPSSGDDVEPIHRLRIRVLSDDGQPIASARITALDAYPTGYPAIDRLMPTARFTVRTSDSDGHVSITTSKPLALQAEGPEGRLGFVERVEPHAGVLEMVLSPPALLDVDGLTDLHFELQSEQREVPFLMDTARASSGQVPAGHWWVLVRSGEKGAVHRLRLAPGQKMTLPPPTSPLSPTELVDEESKFRFDRCDARLRPSFRQPDPSEFAARSTLVFCQSDKESSGGDPFVWSRTVLRPRSRLAPEAALELLRSVRPEPDPKAPPGATVQQIVAVGASAGLESISQFGTLTSLPSGSLLLPSDGQALVIYTEGADRFVTVETDLPSVLVPRAEPGLVLEIVVRSPEGDPIPGIQALTGLDRHPVFRREALGTDDGVVVFTRLSPTGERLVVLRREDGFPRRFEITGGAKRAEVRWEDGAPVQGVALGPDRRPLANLIVELRCPELGDQVAEIYRTTDANGVFEFGDLPPRIYRLGAYATIDGSPFIGSLRVEPRTDGGVWELCLEPEDPPPPGGG
ncbi:MAG: hypothetical protein AAF196_16425 [Planctomycetota bacterium]